MQKGGADMLDVQLDVRHMFVESFTSVTEKIAGFPLRCCAEKKDFKIGQIVKIRAEGVFRASLYISMEETFEDAVYNGMTKGKVLPPNMHDLYVGEYINIISGHALTNINNMMGQTSRLTVPVVGISEKNDSEEYKKQCTLYFEAPCGNMKMDISYND